jgi:hypothetical protein
MREVRGDQVAGLVVKAGVRQRRRDAERDIACKSIGLLGAYRNRRGVVRLWDCRKSHKVAVRDTHV